MFPQISSLFLLLHLHLHLLPPISALDFTFTTFNSTHLLTYGTAAIQSSVLTLTQDHAFSIGRALYPKPIPTKSQNASKILPFSTSFIFSVTPYPDLLPGHGFSFIFVPSTGINGTSSAQFLGLFNISNNGDPNNHVLAIKFDVFMNREYGDISDNHVGVNVNSLSSITEHQGGYWVRNDADGELKFEELKLNNGDNYQVWVDYLDSQLNVTMAPAGVRRPQRPLINVSVDLDAVFLDQMYVGFTGANGQLIENHRVLSWCFSNTNFSIGDALPTRHLPSFVIHRGSVFRSVGFIVGVTVGGLCVIGFGLCVYFVLVQRKRRKKKVPEVIEDWELEYWPHRIEYQEIFTATNGFSDENVIGFGGNGKVYRGVLVGGAEVAVKRIPHKNEHSMREFLNEVSSIGRLQHRNLVGMRGWCKGEKDSLILVYDFMENGSLDKRLFECDQSTALSWEERVKLLKDVACGILYLHEGWEAKVLHRDIKASNVLLDKDMTGRLGDFGLAHVHHHGELASTTQVVGTTGYMAPEVILTGRVSTQTDVFGFGVLVLEVVSGRRPMEEGKPELVDWVRGLQGTGKIICALDERLKFKNGYEEEDVEKVLNLALSCLHSNPKRRPKMRQILMLLEGNISELNQYKGEGIEINLPDSTVLRTSYYRKHGVKEDTPENACSISLSFSDVIVEGR